MVSISRLNVYTDTKSKCGCHLVACPGFDLTGEARYFVIGVGGGGVDVTQISASRK